MVSNHHSIIRFVMALTMIGVENQSVSNIQTMVSNHHSIIRFVTALTMIGVENRCAYVQAFSCPLTRRKTFGFPSNSQVHLVNMAMSSKSLSPESITTRENPSVGSQVSTGSTCPFTQVEAKWQEYWRGMKGHNILHPIVIAWDAFRLAVEQLAVQTSARSFQNPAQNKFKDKSMTPPMATVSMWETIQSIAGSDAPFFLLRTARQLGPSTKIFRIPIPIQGGVYVISTDRQCAKEIMHFIAGGYETTGYTLATTLVLLAKHPEVADKVYQEQAKVGRTQISEYLACVIKESRRFLPPAALFSSRQYRESVQLGSYKVPAGAILLLPQMLPHRDERVFGPDPDAFRPERWLGEPSKEMDDSLLTFAAGTRNCVGQALAMAELESVLPRLLSTYRFTIEEEGNLDFFVSLKFSGTRLRAERL